MVYLFGIVWLAMALGLGIFLAKADHVMSLGRTGFTLIIISFLCGIGLLVFALTQEL